MDHFISIFSKFLNFSFITGILVLLSNCENDPNQIGLGMFPDSDNINVMYTDTFTIEASTITDSIITSASLIPLGTSGTTLIPLGTYNDSVFGNITCGFITEYIPYNDAYYKIKKDYQADSVFLDLYIGSMLCKDTNFFPQLSVYELTESIDEDKDYYNTFNPEGRYSSTNIFESYTTDTTQSIRIRLNNSLGNSLLSDYDSIAYIEERETQTSFKDIFKGLYIKPSIMSTSEGKLYNIIAESCYLVVYYTNDENKVGTITYIIYPRTILKDDKKTFATVSCKKFALTNFKLKSNILNNLNNTNSEALYIQSLGGTGILLDIPYLENLKQVADHILINKAEIILPIGSFESKAYPAIPLQLSVRKQNDEILTGDIASISNSGYGYSYIGGSYIPTESGYSINLNAYIQELLNGKIVKSKIKIDAGAFFYGLYNTGFNSFSYKSVFIDNKISSDKRIKLRLTYTILND